DVATLRTVAELASLEEIYGQFHVLSGAEQTLRHASNPFLGLEMTLVRMTCIGRVQPLQHILEHLERLETDLPATSVAATSATAQEGGTSAALARSVGNGLEAGQLSGRAPIGVFEAAAVSYAVPPTPTRRSRPEPELVVPVSRAVPEAPISTAPDSALLTTA